jgi:pimeloyl-ACP methyl ester carboxylesterase
MSSEGVAWWPNELASIAARLGIVASDLTPPRRLWQQSADGVMVHGLDWGGAGPSAVLLHGGGLTARSWDYVALALRAHFRVIALDLRGHGDSDWADDYSFESAVADVVAVLDGVHIERAHIAGMSLGGQVGAWFAQAHPQRTVSLVMVDVAPGVDFEATARMRDFMSDFPGVTDVEAAVELALGVNPRADRDRLRYRFRAMLKQHDEGVLAWKSDPRRPPDYHYILGRLEQLALHAPDMIMPFLLVRGGRSKVLSEPSAATFAARFPLGQWRNVSDAGHNVQEDNPAELSVLLGDFWRRC